MVKNVEDFVFEIITILYFSIYGVDRHDYQKARIIVISFKNFRK